MIVDGYILTWDRIVLAADQGAILDDARDALFATWERAGLGDITAQHPDIWTGVRYGE